MHLRRIPCRPPPSHLVHHTLLSNLLTLLPHTWIQDLSLKVEVAPPLGHTALTGDPALCVSSSPAGNTAQRRCEVRYTTRGKEAEQSRAAGAAVQEGGQSGSSAQCGYSRCRMLYPIPGVPAPDHLGPPPPCPQPPPILPYLMTTPSAPPGPSWSSDTREWSRAGRRHTPGLHRQRVRVR